MKIKISLILTLLALSCAKDGVQKEQILGGSGDFRAFSFDSSIRRLHGEWLFRFEKSGDCAAEEMTEQNSILVKTPAYWSSYAQAGQNFPVRGRACFQLNLDLNPEVAIKGGAALFTNDFSSASEIYWNGVLIGKKGITGAGPDEELGDIGPAVWRIPDSLIQAHNTLKIRVSNFHLRGGGMNGEIFLGNSSVLADRIAALERIDFFLLGSILLAGLY